MKINEYFDHIYCINLKRRPDKWQEAKEEFEKHNLVVSRVEAVDGNDLHPFGDLSPATRGCNLSHVMVLRDMIHNGYRRILVLEDDVQFAGNLNQLWELNFENLPDFWQMLYLSGNHQHPPLIYKKGISRASKVFTTHAYGISLGMAQTAVEMIGNSQDMVVDQIYAEMHKDIFAYCFQPQLAIQRPGFSDIRNEDVDYTNHFK